jgi:hypothetical protein
MLAALAELLCQGGAQSRIEASTLTAKHKRKPGVPEAGQGR